MKFYAKVAAETVSSDKLAVQVLPEGREDTDANWETVKEITWNARDTDWTLQTVDLPARQWQRVRLKRTTAGNTWYIDDVTIYGGGKYSGGCLVGTPQTVTGTNIASSAFGAAITPGQKYFVAVQAEGQPAGYTATSGWGETADYTPGVFRREADGFEMMRLGWDASSAVPILVVAATGGDFDGVPAPVTGASYAAGNTLGTGTVVAYSTETKSNTSFEHVFPYSATGESAKYVVYWKRNGYWEGREEVEIDRGPYVCAVAEAFAYTNATFTSGTGDQSQFNGGKGWSGPWNVSAKNTSWEIGEATVSGGTPEGLLETNQIWGAGGNMIGLYPGSSDTGKKVWLKRPMTTALPADEEWWGMFTMKITWTGAGKKWAGMQLLDKDGNNQASIGLLWHENGSNPDGKVGVQNDSGSVRSLTSYVPSNDDIFTVVMHWTGSALQIKTYKRNAGATSPAWGKRRRRLGQQRLLRRNPLRRELGAPGGARRTRAVAGRERGGVDGRQRNGQGFVAIQRAQRVLRGRHAGAAAGASAGHGREDPGEGRQWQLDDHLHGQGDERDGGGGLHEPLGPRGVAGQHPQLPGHRLRQQGRHGGERGRPGRPVVHDVRDGDV